MRSPAFFEKNSKKTFVEMGADADNAHGPE
jgi:hypothetical protein